MLRLLSWMRRALGAAVPAAATAAATAGASAAATAAASAAATAAADDADAAAAVPCEGLLCGSVLSEIGPPTILRSLGATVAAELEDGVAGARYPLLAHGLIARGRIEEAESRAALDEWRAVRAALAAIPVSRMRWSTRDGGASAPGLPVPAGVPVDASAGSLASYLRTTTGRDLILDVLIDNAECGVQLGLAIERVRYADVLEVARRRG